jgi:thiamine-phosphate pyrophosphorylase
MTTADESGSDSATTRRCGDLRVIAITDRRLMVPADLLATADWPAIAAAFGEAVQRALDGCAPGQLAVQVREKDLDGGPLLLLVQAAQRHCNRVLVNDRLDVALAAGAFGVHLPERGLAIADARALGPHLVVGVSRHAAPLDAAADLIHLGPIWPTPSKPGAPTLGEAALAWPRAAPLVAVGGIDSPERAEIAAVSGADAIAVIRAAWTGASLAPFIDAVDRGRTRRAWAASAV